MGPAVGATDLPMRCTGRCCTRGWGRRGARQLHRRIGLRLEAGYGAQAKEIAAQLAVHFERGGEIPRAVHYWQQAGDNAARRNAHHEAIAALQERARIAGDAAGEPRAHPARARAPARPGGAAEGHEGGGVPGRGRRLHPGLYPVPAGGGDAAARSGPLGALAVS